MTSDELQTVPTCPVCGSDLVVTPSGYAACAEGLDHTKLIPLEESGRMKRIMHVKSLPVATRDKKMKASLYRVNGRIYGRLMVNDGRHCTGEFTARTQDKNGRWYCIRLVPFGDNSKNDTWR